MSDLPKIRICHKCAEMGASDAIQAWGDEIERLRHGGIMGNKQRTRGLSILGYNRELDKKEDEIEHLCAALDDALPCLDEHDPEVAQIAREALEKCNE